DQLHGDDGDDAIYGGSDDDTLYGGLGNDNLYGTDGYQDKHPELSGKDVGLGQSGHDWFETDYHWLYADRNDREDNPIVVQNTLVLDSSVGQYTGGNFYGGSLSLSNSATIRGGTLGGSGAVL